MGDAWLGIPGGGNLHSWLIESSYVKERDDEAKKKSKKGKSHFKNKSPFHPDTSDQVSVESPVIDVGRRKYRRWMNERLLRDLAGPLDAAAISDLYAPPPWGVKPQPTVLETVTSVQFQLSKDPLIWETFQNGHDFETNRKKNMEFNDGPLSRWRMVERNAREALKRSKHWPLLADLEEKLVSFKEASIANQEEGVMNLELDSKYQSLLVHGICQFHGLLAESFEEILPEGNCLMKVSCKGNTLDNSANKSFRLSGFLLAQ